MKGTPNMSFTIRILYPSLLPNNTHWSARQVTQVRIIILGLFCCNYKFYAIEIPFNMQLELLLFQLNIT